MTSLWMKEKEESKLSGFWLRQPDSDAVNQSNREAGEGRMGG